MTIHYFDPSAWAKRHFEETGSTAVSDLFRKQIVAACCEIGLPEMKAAIARKAQGDSIAGKSIREILFDVSTDFDLFQRVTINETRLSYATELAIRHRLRALDALHLACALSLQQQDQDVVMVSADVELLVAADKERLRTFNPSNLETHP